MNGFLTEEDVGGGGEFKGWHGISDCQNEANLGRRILGKTPRASGASGCFLFGLDLPKGFVWQFGLRVLADLSRLAQRREEPAFTGYNGDFRPK